MEALLVLGVVGLIYGSGIALAAFRLRKDASRGDLNEAPTPLLLSSGAVTFRQDVRVGEGQATTVTVAARATGPEVETVEAFSPAFQRSCWRMRVTGLASSRVLGMRITKHRRKDASLEVKTTRHTTTAQVMAQGDVLAALRTLCGGPLRFRAVDLYPDGDLVVDALPGGALGDAAHADMVARMIDFALSLEAASETLERAPALGGVGGASGSPVSFSIDVR